MKLKISSGKLKRSNIKVPKSAKPVKTVVKQSVFNYLGNSVEGKTIADLYAGSGNLAFEAISRGAEYAILVDNDYNAVKTIKENIVSFNLHTKIEVQKEDVLKFVGGSPEQFDIVFADPPYELSTRHFLKNIHLIIKKQGVFVYFYSKQSNIPTVEKMKPVKTQCFGKSCYTVYK